MVAKKPSAAILTIFESEARDDNECAATKYYDIGWLLGLWARIVRNETTGRFGEEGVDAERACQTPSSSHPHTF